MNLLCPRFVRCKRLGGFALKGFIADAHFLNCSLAHEKYDISHIIARLDTFEYERVFDVREAFPSRE